MATIQLPSLPAIGSDPASGDLLLIRSSGVDYKVDYNDLVPIRDDTTNIFTASNTFNVLTTFVGHIKTDEITSVGGSEVAMTDGLATNVIEPYTGDTTTFNQKIDVLGQARFDANAILLDRSAGSDEFLLVSNLLNPVYIPQADESTIGGLEVATQAEVDTKGTTNDTHAVTPKKLYTSHATLKHHSTINASGNTTLEFINIPDDVEYIKILINNMRPIQHSSNDYVGVQTRFSSGSWNNAAQNYRGVMIEHGIKRRVWNETSDDLALLYWNSHSGGERFDGVIEMHKVSNDGDTTNNHYWIIKSSMYDKSNGYIHDAIGRIDVGLNNTLSGVRVLTLQRYQINGSASVWYQ